MKELEKSSRRQLCTPVEDDVIVGQQSSDAGCNLPFPASQKSLGHLSFSVYTDLLGGVIWLDHGHTGKKIQSKKSESKSTQKMRINQQIFKVMFKLTLIQFYHIQVAFQGLGNLTCCLWWTSLCCGICSVQESHELQQKVPNSLPSATWPCQTQF